MSDTAGVPFTITYPAPRVRTILTGTITNTIITVNQTLNYDIQWTGTGILPQNTLVLDNLGPGDYLHKSQLMEIALQLKHSH